MAEDTLPPPAPAPSSTPVASAAPTISAPAATAMTEQEARSWAVGTHLAGLIGLIGLPSFIGPLVVWLVKRNDHPFIDANGKEAVNFHLTVLIYFVVSIVLALILIGVLFLLALAVFVLIMAIVAAMKASEGQVYRYPLTIRFMK